jgi:hypothetical protein
MDIVEATEVLATVTGGLVVLGVLQFVTARRQAADQREATKALAASARATQAMADEMLEERRGRHPLGVQVERRTAEPGVFEATIRGVFGQATILRRLTLHVGQGMNVPDEPVAKVEYGNAYLTGTDGQYVHEVFASPPFDSATGDLLVVKVTGRPQNGLEQTREFLYRIEPERTLKSLAIGDVADVVFSPPGSRG